MVYALNNIVFVLFGAIIAIFEGRFYPTQMGPNALPWLYHGGSWADLILITFIVGVVGSCPKQWKKKTIMIFGLICGIITVAFHIFWALTMPVLSHIVDPVASGFAKLPIGGYYHLLYMWVILTIISLYYFATPGAKRFKVSILLSIFVVAAVMQPSYYVLKIVEGHGRIDLSAWIVSIMIWAAVWGIGYRRP